ncbi:MAG: PTPA-CTERM sorting domain-containing protein [Cyanobacteria bacterium REEB459]|nr:PTPA-CTERM sorting domain-containing protein [Cyanobacteria bacterium REEB459]
MKLGNSSAALVATCCAVLTGGIALEAAPALATSLGGEVMPATAIVGGYSLTDAASVQASWLPNGGPLPATPFSQIVSRDGLPKSYTVTDSAYLYVPVFYTNNAPPPFPDPFPETLAAARFALFDPSQNDLSGAVRVDGKTTILGPEYLVGPVSFSQNGSTFKQYQHGTFLTPLAPGLHNIEVELFQSGISQGSIAYSLQSHPTAVPTPALLPGLIAFGLRALGKRRAEARDAAEV